MNTTLPIVNERSVETGVNVIDMENLIKRKVENLDKIKIEIRQKKEMYDDSFNSDASFQEKKKAALVATNAKKKLAVEIAKQPSVLALKKELEDLNLSKREQERGISNLLVDYTTKRPDVTQLELFDGRFAQIVKTAKLSKPKKPKKAEVPLGGLIHFLNGLSAGFDSPPRSKL